MSVLTDINKLREENDKLRRMAELNAERVATHEEQINGKRGLQAAIDELAEEIRSLRRALWTVGGGIVLASIGFGFSVLSLIH